MLGILIFLAGAMTFLSMVFGLTGFPTNYVVVAKNGEKDVIFFEVGSDSPPSGYAPVWTGCILKAERPITIPILLFRCEGEGEEHRKVPEAWKKVDVEEGFFRGYTLASPNVELALEMLKGGVARVLARVAKAVEGGVLPKYLALQVSEDRVALYSDQGTLTEVDQFLALYRGQKGFWPCSRGKRIDLIPPSG